MTYGTQLKVTIAKYYTPSGRCIQELDYANRDKNGEVPKFSNGTVTSFKTKNGRVVFDGGGVQPDIFLGFSKRNETTEKLLQSQAIFNFTTDYFYKNPSVKSPTDFSFSSTDFKNFQNYILQSDSTFKTKQEQLFLDAYQSIENDKIILKEYQQILKKLSQEKVSEISKNKDFISDLIKDEILKRYYYSEGAYQHKLKNDKVVLEAVKILKNKTQYAKILKGA